ncbi:MAG TPA: PIN domain-containing protein [Longimicrobium sp.]|nr:PIN domain-containing protein [Longimicrobium sp.]
MSYVLDACAMIAYLNGEPGAAAVDGMLKDTGRECFAHSINLCEVYYDALRAADESTADQAIQDLVAAGVVERNEMDPTLWREVGKIKSRGRISIADAFCAALTNRVSGDAVTSDRREFEPLAAAGVCSVTFIR